MTNRRTASGCLILLLLGATVPAMAGEQVAPGDNLVLKNIPAIPLDLARQVRRYQHMRSASFADWTPENQMLILTRFAQTAQVHRVSGPGAARSQLTFFDERVAWARHCPGKGCAFFVFGMDEGGSEAFQIYRFDLKTGLHHRLTDGKSRNGEAIFDRSGRRIAFASTRRNGRDFDLYLMDPLGTGEPTLLAQTEGLWQPLDFSPDGKTLLAQHYRSINDSSLHLVDVASGQMRRVGPVDPESVAYPDARFSADGKGVYLTTDRRWEFVRLAYLDLARKTFEPRFLLADLDWDVSGFDLSGDGRHLAVVTNQDGFSRLAILDARSGRKLAAPGLPAGIVTGLRFSPDSKQLAIGLQGSRVPGDVFVYDLRKRKLTRWTESETGGLDVSGFAEPRVIRYPTFDMEGDGPRQIPALVYLPPARFKPPHPVVVSIHGGPESQARPVFLGRTNHRIQEMGIALIEPNVRGSSGYGKTYLQLDNGKQREDAVRDIGALLDWIASQPDLDKRRVAVVGGSYGGYMSLASLTYYSDRLRCGVDYVGISNFVTFLKNTQSYRRDLRRIEYGDERDPGMNVFLEMISPLANADKIKVPLLVVQGANDPRVPATEAEQIVQRVERNTGTVWYLLAKDEGHGFAKKSNQDFLDLTLIQFLQTYLLGQG